MTADLRDIEREVVGTLMGSEHALADALDLLTEEDFQSAACRMIFGAARSISARGHLVDIKAIAHWMREHHPEAKEVYTKLADMLIGAPGEPFMSHRCGILVEATALRRLRVGLTTAVERSVQAVPGNGTLDEIMEDLSSLTLHTRTIKGSERAMSVEAAIDAGFAEMDEAQEMETRPGFQTGLPGLDELWGGLRKGEMIVVASDTGMGKSLFVANVALKAAGNEWEWLGWKRPHVMYVSTEMRLPDLAKRFIAIRSGLDMTRIRDGRLDAGERQRAQDAAQWLRELNLTLDARGKPKLGKVLRMARSEKRLGRLDLLVIDLVSHIKHEGKVESREQQLAQVSEAISDLGVELDIPVLVTSQINKNVKLRANKMPNLGDVRYSAGIEHDASIVMFLWRNEEWNANRMDAFTAKARNGAIGNTSLSRVPRYAKFETLGAEGMEQGVLI